MRLSHVRASSRGSARAALAASLVALLAALTAACGSGEAEPPQSLDFSARAVG